MQENKIYTDRYNNRCLVISKDFTGLNRGIVYAQFIDRVVKPVTKQQLIENTRKNTFTAHTFAIWNYEFNKYKSED